MADGENTANSRRISGSTKIPVGEMARDNLDKIFPHLTPEQVVALKEGLPVPPSPDWVAQGELRPEYDLSKLKPVPRGVPDVRRIAALQQDLDEARDLLREKVRREEVFEGLLKSMRSGPLVTAVLLYTDPTNRHLKRTRSAVNQFVGQSYPNKQIVVVNTTDTPVTNVAHKDVREIAVPDFRGKPAGFLRGHAIGRADGDLVYPYWEDGNMCDRDLLAYMVQNHAAGRAVVLNSQFRVDTENSVAYVHVEEDGIPNTVVVPKTAAEYPDLPYGDDVAFFTQNWVRKADVVDNRAWPLNSLKICVFDRLSAWPVEQFMRPPAPDGANYGDSHGRWVLGANEAEHVKAVFTSYGFKVGPKAPEGSTQPVVA